MNSRVTIQKKLGLPVMFDCTQLLQLGMETFLMAEQPACVSAALFIMILRQERKILLRVTVVAISCVTQSLETKLRSQVRTSHLTFSKDQRVSVRFG